MPTPHIEEDLLDQYAIGTLPEDSVAGLEEHLLVCQFCQRRLLETDEVVTLFRVAATQMGPRTPRESKSSSIRILSWACATAVVALLVFLTPRERPNTELPATLLMQSLRGPEARAHMASGKPYVLVFDLAVPATQVDYEIAMVDALGNEILRTSGIVRDGRLSVFVEKLERGSYWVRVYRKRVGRELVAEYGLRAD